LRAAAVAFVTSMLVGTVLTPIVRDAAHRFGLLDYGLSSRKIHGRPVPRLGGVAIVAAFIFPLAALFFANSEVGARLWNEPRETLAFIAGSLVVAALGVFDDLKGCRARTKLSVQFLVAACMYWAGFRIDHVSLPFGPALSLGPLALPVTMAWIAGIINAMNLIDGLDGLAGGVALIAVTTIFTLAALRAEPLMLLFTAALAGAIIGFLFYNFNPATIFMGDTGSMFLGFVLATTAIRTSTKSTTVVAIVVPILALGVPISDTLLAMGRRAIRGAPIFSADRGHIHHRLIDRGFSHRAAVLVIYVGATVFGLGALLLSYTRGVQAAIVLTVLASITFLALRALGMVNFSAARAVLADRRRNLDVRAEVRKAGERLRHVQSPVEVWHVVKETVPCLGAVGCGLTLGRLQGRPESGPWSWNQKDLPPEALFARYGLIAERTGDDHLDLAWCDGRDTVHRDTEIAIELLCDHVSSAVDRLERAALEDPQIQMDLGAKRKGR